MLSEDNWRARMHAYAHTHAHTRTHTYIHACTCTNTRISMEKFTFRRLYACTDMRMRMHTGKWMQHSRLGVCRQNYCCGLWRCNRVQHTQSGGQSGKHYSVLPCCCCCCCCCCWWWQCCAWSCRCWCRIFSSWCCCSLAFVIASSGVHALMLAVACMP